MNGNISEEYISIEEKERLIIDRFSSQMLIELQHNRHKGSILHWDDFDNIVTEFEYHKAKIFLAIRCGNSLALKEYIADWFRFVRILSRSSLRQTPLEIPA